MIELLVVVLILGTLAAIALPQYVRVVETARLREGLTFIGNVKKGMEANLTMRGNYPTTVAGLAALDPAPPGTSPGYGMRFFDATGLAAGAAGVGLPCGNGLVGFTITLSRLAKADGAALSNRYGAYTVTFDSCAGGNGRHTYSNANATADFPS